MSTFLIFLAGILFLAGGLFIKPRAKQDKTWKTVIIWILYIIFFAVACMGISFVTSMPVSDMSKLQVQRYSCLGGFR